MGSRKDLSDRVQKVLLKDFDLSGLDLSWMARLKDYDYWEVYSIGKGKKALEESLAEHRFMPKAPAIMDLMTLARARFIQGVQTGKIREALSEIENLGRLMMTSEILLPYMIGLSLYYGSLPQYEGLALKVGILSGPARVASRSSEYPTFKANFWATVSGGKNEENANDSLDCTTSVCAGS
jgi:hypothetical protein